MNKISRHRVVDLGADLLGGGGSDGVVARIQVGQSELAGGIPLAADNWIYFGGDRGSSYGKSGVGSSRLGSG